MVHIASKNREIIHTWVDNVIPRLIDVWQELPLASAEIAEWRDVEAVDYIEEFRFYESQRHDLERDAENELLTETQMSQLEDLRKLVRKHWELRNWMLGV